MPPKRAASSNKRKAESDSDGEKPVGSKKTTKQAKVDALTEDTGLAPNGQPTNKVLPVKISFPPRSERTTCIASWNICSLASSQKKVCFDAVIFGAGGTPTMVIQGFKHYVEAEDPDILILTETKVGSL